MSSELYRWGIDWDRWGILGELMGVQLMYDLCIERVTRAL